MNSLIDQVCRINGFFFLRGAIFSEICGKVFHAKNLIGKNTLNIALKNSICYSPLIEIEPKYNTSLCNADTLLSTVNGEWPIKCSKIMNIHTFNVCKHGLLKHSKLGYTALFNLFKVWLEVYRCAMLTYFFYFENVFLLVLETKWNEVMSFKILSICDIKKIEIVNITYTYSTDKLQKFAPTEKNSYTV
jgi:hypothetical protein